MQDRTAASDRQEVEWQFDVLDVRPVARWLEGRSPEGRPSVGAGGEREISDTYFDTGDWRIYRAGYALRVRSKKGGAAEATMKLLAPADGASAGLRRRREISEPLGGAKPGDLDGASGPVGEKIRALAGSRALRPIFEVRTSRSAHALSLNGADVGEVALDETTISLEDDKEPAVLRRVEVEVEPGARPDLEPFVEELREECRLTPTAASKYEAALFVRGLEPPGPPEFGPTGVDAGETVGEAAFAVMREQFALFLAHEPGTRLGEDPEELHDMRVASRRLRAAMRLFEDALPVRARRLQEELKYFAGLLGEVRDLDVQLERLEDLLSDAAQEDRASLGELVSVLEDRRTKARKKMLRALDSRRYTGFVDSFSGLLRRGPSRRSRAARRPVLAVAPDLIRGRYRKVRKAGDRIAQDSPAEEYHTLRKRARRLRYGLEFLSDVYGDPTKDLIRPLKALQDVLGDHQDAAVAKEQLRELVADGARRRLSPEAAFAMGAIAHRHEIEVQKLREVFPEAYRGIKGKGWKRLKKEMEKSRPRTDWS